MILPLLALTATATPSASFQEQLTGIYQANVSEQQLEVITEAAVERAASSLPWAFRPFARPQLRRTTGLCERTQLKLTSTRFSAVCLSQADKGFDYPLSGAIPPHLDGEDEYQVTLTLREGASVTVRHAGEKGGIAVRYTPTSGGGLEVQKRVFSQHLPEDLVWAIPYVRVP